MAALLASGAVGARAQVLRIGGFDFNSSAHLEGVYSSNVERERPGQTIAEPEDYYLAAGIDLTSKKQTGPGSKIDIDTGINVEKHFVRDDLDNSSNPFGRVRLRLDQDFGRLKAFGEAAYESLSDSNNDQFSPDGLGKARDPRVETRYLGGATYDRGHIGAIARYGFRQERHSEEQFKLRDVDETTTEFSSGYEVSPRFRPGYAYDMRDSVYPSSPSSDRTEVNHRFLFPFQLMRKPMLEYTFIWQKEDLDNGVEPQWEPRHTVMLSDFNKISPSLDFKYSIMYDNEQNPEQDDIQVIYSAALTHHLSRTTTHELSAERKPVSTFGSTLKSDITRYRYAFRKTDLFIYNLNFDAYVEKEDSVPKGDEGLDKIETIRYALDLVHGRMLSRRLSRSIAYNYFYEDISNFDEPLKEHRVTLSYTYDF